MGSGSQIRGNAEGTMQNTPGPRLWESSGVRGTMPGGAPQIEMSVEPCYWHVQAGRTGVQIWQLQELQLLANKILKVHSEEIPGRYSETQ